ncbi:MAG: hypothetical protein Q7S07_04230 [Candidatus Omnitrophota bacterium]|nr:hypothetical protein [Candidatus Omnitrophota bacterium]
MGYRRYPIWTFVITLCVISIFTFRASASGEDRSVTSDYINESKNITQSDLAVILVHSMGSEPELPPAPMTKDFISALDKNGIRPLGGWDVNAMLTKGDFAVILVRAMGLDRKLVTAREACDIAVEAAQRKWEIQCRADGHYETLEKFLKDNRFFPNGPPENPFGHEYADIDGDYKIEPVVFAQGHQELQPSIRYIYTLENAGITVDGPPAKILTLAIIRQALRSPIFRSAPGNAFLYGFKEAVTAAAEKSVTPITAGGP